MTAARWLWLVAACLVAALLGPVLRRLYQRFVKWPDPRAWQHPAGRVKRRR